MVSYYSRKNNKSDANKYILNYYKSFVMATKHCCYGTCRSDSRYMHAQHMKDVFFIPFPKPYAKKCDATVVDKCKRWVHACRREGFTIASVKKDTYICSLHFVGGKGPTIDHPDPIPATISQLQVGAWSITLGCPWGIPLLGWSKCHTTSFHFKHK